jgi:3-oxoadipate enol-lactonase
VTAAATANADFPELHRPAQPSTRPPLVLLHGGNVANWMWEPQVAAFRDRVVVTPDLPGFGARVAEDWPGLDAVADDLIRRLDGLGISGPVDVAGLSLGAVTTIRVLARHPERVRSALVTGAALVGVGPLARLTSRAQLSAWRAPWFWRAQAAAFRIPQDARELYVSHGLSVRRETAAAMLAEVYAGGVPAALETVDRPLLAIAGEKEPGEIRRSLTALGKRMPQARLRLAPGMHHIWSIEDVELFNATLRAWFDEGRPEERLLPFGGNRG